MSFDRTHGEALDGLERSLHVVVPARLLASMDNLKTPYKIPGKFRARIGTRPIFDDAVANAIEAFAEAGALRPIRFDEDDVLVQVYPKDSKVAIMFQRRIVDKDHYVTRLYDLPQPVLDDLLKAAGGKTAQH
jgi:hypothetical protein